MSDKAVDRSADAVKGAVDNTRDTIHEAQHRTAAEIEKQKREHDTSMTAGEKVGSMAKEAKELTQAEIDAAKKEARKGH